MPTKLRQIAAFFLFICLTAGILFGESTESIELNDYSRLESGGTVIYYRESERNFARVDLL